MIYKTREKRVVEQYVEVEIKPSDVYSCTQTTLAGLLCSHNLMIVGFRPAKEGEQFIAAPSGQGTCTGPLASAPRFIVVPFITLSSAWE